MPDPRDRPPRPLAYYAAARSTYGGTEVIKNSTVELPADSAIPQPRLYLLHMLRISGGLTGPAAVN